MRIRFRCIAAVFAMVALVCTASLAAIAAPPVQPPGSGRPVTVDKPGQVLVQVMNRFEDLENALWALKAIEKLTLSGVTQGYGDGTFRPGNQITHTEALTMALRLMGHNDADAQTTGDELPARLVDFQEIPGWARGYVGLGIAAELIPGDGVFSPAAPALRNWAAMLLVRAAGLDDEAQEQMNATLDFTDAGDIPQGYGGYIAVAVAHGLIRGFPDGSVQPNAPITRAQMAALMERAEEMVQNRHRVNTGRRITGTVIDKSDPVDDTLATLTLEREDEEEGLVTTEHDVVADASIYLRDVPGTWDDVWVGDKVQLRLNEDGQVIFIEVKAEQEEFEGTVVEVTDESITIALEDGTEGAFALAGDVVVRFRGSQAGLDVIMAGDWVELKVVHDVVWTIVFGERAEEELEGEVLEVAGATDTSPVTLTIRLEGGTERTVAVSGDAVVRYKGEVLDLDFVEVGDVVEVSLQGGVAVKVVIQAREVPEGDE